MRLFILTYGLVQDKNLFSMDMKTIKYVCAALERPSFQVDILEKGLIAWGAPTGKRQKAFM